MFAGVLLLYTVLTATSGSLVDGPPCEGTLVHDSVVDVRDSGDSASPALFSLDWATGGLADMGESVTIGGTTYTSVLSYQAANASASGWAATNGPNLTAAGSGGSFDESVAWNSPADAAIDFEGTRHYTASLGSPIALEDGVIEIVWRGRPSANAGIITLSDSGSSALWRIMVQSTGTVGGEAFNDGTGNSFPNIGTAVPDGWNHGFYAFDRSAASSAGATNGIGSSSGGVANLSTRSAAWSFDTITVGELENGNSPSPSGLKLASVRLWTSTGLYDSATEDADVQTEGRDRFARLIGTYESDAGAPTTATRASSAYLTKYDSTNARHELHLVGQNWPRAGSFSDGTAVDCAQLEDQAENLERQSDDFSTSTWRRLNSASGSGLSTTQLSPDPTKFAYEIVSNTSNQSSGVDNFSDQTAYTSGTQYVTSIFARAGAVDWLRIRVDQTAAPSGADQFFDLATATLGASPGSGVDASGVFDLGDGWVRAWIVWTADATAGARIAIFSAEADGDSAYTGDGSAVDIYIFGIQTGEGSAPISYITTTSAAATRAADTLQYDGLDAINSPIVVEFSYLPLGGNALGNAVVLTNGGAFSERVRLTFNPTLTSSNVTALVNSGGSAQFNVSGLGHDFEQDWNDISLRVVDADFDLSIDSTSLASQSSGTASTGLTRISIGSNRSGGVKLGGCYGPITVRQL